MNTKTPTDAHIERLQNIYSALSQITVRGTLNPSEIASNANFVGFCMQETLELVKELGVSSDDDTEPSQT